MGWEARAAGGNEVVEVVVAVEEGPEIEELLLFSRLGVTAEAGVEDEEEEDGGDEEANATDLFGGGSC